MAMSKAVVRWFPWELLTSRRLCAASYSVGSTAVTESEAIPKTKPLFRRLAALGAVPGGGVAETMKEWESEGKKVKVVQLVKLVRAFRRYKNNRRALELVDWMEASGIIITPRVHALRLDVIAKSKGVDEAEKYFANLPEVSRNKSTYEALLGAYCQEKMLDKAIAVHDKMRELNISCDSFIYNNLMTLHMNSGHPEKIPSLFQEMKASNVSPNDVTYCILMKSYSTMNDIDSIERFVTELEEDTKGCLDWCIYSNMASHFIKANLFEKAEPALVKLEAVMDSQDRECYHHLISMYASVGNSAEAIRVWKSLNDSDKTNKSFLIMFQACIKLDEMDMLKQCYGEWNSIGLKFDMRLPYVAMAAYLRKDMLNEVEYVLDTIIEKGCGNDSFWRKLIGYHLRKKEMDLALKSLKFAISCNKPQKWSPEKELVMKFLMCLEEVKDVERAEALYKILKDINGVDMDVYKSLLRTYLASGRKDPTFRQRIEEDGFEPSSETKELLESVCL